MMPPPDSGYKCVRLNHLLVLNQRTSSGGVDPEAGCDQNQQRRAEQQAAFSFQTGFAQKSFQTAIIDHNDAFVDSVARLKGWTGVELVPIIKERARFECPEPEFRLQTGSQYRKGRNFRS